MTDDDATPIAYTALQKGTPVLGVDGAQIAEVERVLDDPSMDLFDGITVQTSDGLRFVDADAVSEITDKYVRTTVASASELPVPDAPPTYRPNEEALHQKDSLWEKTKDLFGSDKPGWDQPKDR
jgi:hypothetical protein